MEWHCRDLRQREYPLLANKMILSQRMHSWSGGTAHVPRTNRVTNSVFIVFAELALLASAPLVVQNDSSPPDRNALGDDIIEALECLKA